MSVAIIEKEDLGRNPQKSHRLKKELGWCPCILEHQWWQLHRAAREQPGTKSPLQPREKPTLAALLLDFQPVALHGHTSELLKAKCMVHCYGNLWDEPKFRNTEFLERWSCKAQGHGSLVLKPVIGYQPPQGHIPDCGILAICHAGKMSLKAWQPGLLEFKPSSLACILAWLLMLGVVAS